MASSIVLIVITWITFLKYIHCGEFYRIEGRSYYVSYPETRNWHQALRYCAYNGLYLVDIHTNAEHNRILSVINQTETKHIMSSQNYWTAGTDLGNEGDFFWATSGHQFMYLGWAAQQPDNSARNENCVHFWAGQNVFGQYQQSDEIPYIFEWGVKRRDTAMGLNHIPSESLKAYFAKKSGGSKTLSHFENTGCLKDTHRRKVVSYSAASLQDNFGFSPSKEEKLAVDEADTKLFPCIKLEVLINSSNSGFLQSKLRNDRVKREKSRKISKLNLISPSPSLHWK